MKKEDRHTTPGHMYRGQECRNCISWITRLYPEYSPDMPSTDYYFVKLLDHFVADKVFNGGTAVKNYLEEFIAFRNPVSYKIGVNAPASRWRKCTEGDYFD